MKTKETNKQYDFSNQPSYNGEPCPAGYELVPAVLTKNLAVYLKEDLLRSNVRTSHMPNGAKVPTVYIPNPIGGMQAAIKTFNADVERYLKHTDEQKIDALSLDEMMDNIDDDDKRGYDPTATTENEDIANLWESLKMLTEELGKYGPHMNDVFKLHVQGYSKKEILEQVDLGKGKTQGYSYIEKTLKTAFELYKKKYSV